MSKHLLAIFVFLALLAQLVSSCDPVAQTKLMFDAIQQTGNMTAVLMKFAQPMFTWQMFDASGKINSSFTGPTTGASAFVAVVSRWQALMNETLTQKEYYGAVGSPNCIVVGKNSIEYMGGNAIETFVQIFTYDLRSCFIDSFGTVEDTLLLYTVLNSAESK